MYQVNYTINVSIYYHSLRIRLYVLRKGLPLHVYSFRMGLEPKTSENRSEGVRGFLGDDEVP